MQRLQGWECPRCHAVLAPFMPFCTNCKDGKAGDAIKRVYPITPVDALAKHPQQRVEIDEDGEPRFVCNQMIASLYRLSRTRMDVFFKLDFNDDDRTQFLELIGYDIPGYEEMDFVSDKKVEASKVQVEKLLPEFGRLDNATD